MRRKKRPHSFSYLTSMLDLLSGAFACSVLLFVIFAALRNTDSVSETRTFLIAEATASGIPTNFDSLGSLELVVTPIVMNPRLANPESGMIGFQESAVGRKFEPWPTNFSPVGIGVNGSDPRDTTKLRAIDVHLTRLNGQFLVQLMFRPDELAIGTASSPNSSVKFSLKVVYSCDGKVCKANHEVEIELDRLIESYLATEHGTPTVRFQEAQKPAPTIPSIQSSADFMNPCIIHLAIGVSP